MMLWYLSPSQLSNPTESGYIVAYSHVISLLVRSGTTSIRLHCTVPTWSSSTDTCAFYLSFST
jgi:hypothetical protein